MQACMSDSKEGEQDEALAREDDELIAGCSRNLHHVDEGTDGDGKIDCQLQHQQSWIPLDQRKGKNKNEKDTKVNSNSNRRKMQVKAKKFLHSRLSRFDKHLEGTKNKMTAATTQRSVPPFPYNGEDFGGSHRYACFLRPSIPPFSSSPIHTRAAAAANTPSVVNTAKPKSSYYDVLKSLIEKNDFYSPECNAHHEIHSSQHK